MAQANTKSATAAAAPAAVVKAARKKREPVPANETAAQRFKRLGSARLGKAIKALKNVAALAGRGYESTDEQAAKVKALIATQVTAINEAFDNRNKAAAAAVKESIEL